MGRPVSRRTLPGAGDVFTECLPKYYRPIMTSYRHPLYPSDVRNSDHHARAFVLQLDPGADPGAGRFAGRAEHVASGRTTRFASAEELLVFVARVLDDPDDPDDPPA